MIPLFRCLALLVAAVLPLHAAVVIGTMGLTPVDNTDAFSYTQWQASAIASTMDPETEDWLVQGLDVRVTPVVTNQFLQVQLVEETAFRPDLSKVVATFDPTPLTDSPTLNTPAVFSLSVVDQPPLLEAGSNYWIVMGASSTDPDAASQNGLYYWSYAIASGATDAPTGWSAPDQIANSGAGGANWTPSSLSPFIFELQLAAVPEPSATGVIAGLIAFWVLFFRRYRGTW